MGGITRWEIRNALQESNEKATPNAEISCQIDGFGILSRSALFMTDRRQFLATLAGCAVSHPLTAGEPKAGKLKIGLLADIHKDIMHDADRRLAAFVAEMKKEAVDAVIQLGDFCTPKPVHAEFRDLFQSLPCPVYHVIGNHEMDGGYSREDVVDFLGMKGRYYSFDLGGFHIVVLDANDRPPGWSGGYPSYIQEDQLKWLEADLAATSSPTFVFSHQSLERPECIDNQEAVRAVLEAARMADGTRKVAGCFNGHWHIDHQRVIAGIPYIHINSASYFWMGGEYRHERLPERLAKDHPWVAHTAPYQEALFTILEIDPEAACFSLKARRSAWMGPSPAEVGYPLESLPAEAIRPEIRQRRFELGG